MRVPVELDLSQTESFPVTYQAGDPKDPQVRRSDRSRTLKLPGTRNNSSHLARLFEVTADVGFDPNVRRDCFALVDGVQVFDGSLRLVQAERTGDTVAYDVALTGTTSDLFASLKAPDGTELRLRDLDRSRWSHRRDRETIVATWLGSGVVGGTSQSTHSVGPTHSVTGVQDDGGRTSFTLGSTHSISPGQTVRFLSSAPTGPSSSSYRTGHHTVTAVGATSVTVNLAYVPGFDSETGDLNVWECLGRGVVYPTVNTGKSESNDTAWLSSDYVPAVFAREVLSMLEQTSGYRLESEFLGSEEFSRLTVWQSSEPSLLCDAVPADLGSTATGTSMLRLDHTENYNFGRSFGPSLWTVSPERVYGNFGATATRSLRVSGTVRFDAFVPYNAETVRPWVSKVELLCYRSLDASGSTAGGWPDGTGGYGLNGGDPLVRTLLFVQEVPLSGVTFGHVQVANPYATYSPVNQGGTGVRTGYMYFDVGVPDVVFRPQEQVRFFLRITHTTTGPLLGLVAGSLKDDEVVPRCDVTAREFLSALFCAFNLMAEPDRARSRTLKVEPFDGYYDTGTPVDWTRKRDVSRPMTVTPTSPEMARVHMFSWERGTDFHSKGYADAYGRTYGSRRQVRENDFSRETREVTCKGFASTVTVDTRGGTDLPLPTVVSNANWGRPDSVQPRMLRWTGLRHSPIGFSLDGTTTGNSTYGFAGTQDSPLDATVDLLFDQPELYYYGGGGAFYVAEDTLWASRWSRWHEELTDRQGRRVTAWFQLTPRDVADLDFGRLVQVDGVNYRLLKVQDYDPVSEGPTQVELLLVKRASAYASTVRTRVRPGAFTYSELPGRRNQSGDGNSVPSGTSTPVVTVSGSNNDVTASVSVTVLGDSNKVTSGDTVFVVGNSNRV